MVVVKKIGYYSKFFLSSFKDIAVKNITIGTLRDVEKITSEYNVAEDWQGIMDFCDKVKSTPNSSKEALKCIMKRVNHPIPHVAMQALTLLGACSDNCGKPFHLEICSREWTNEAKVVIVRSHGKVSEKLRELIQKWAEAFKEDAQLNLMCHFYKKLKADGFSFDFVPTASGGVASSQTSSQVKDDLSFKEDIDLAIAMSLQESNNPPASQAPSSSLYPSVPQSASSSSSSSAPAAPAEEKELFQVRALYDFEAAEDNEMTFKAGEVFAVLDNSDENWWKGRNTKGIGLFPANFVTTELQEKTEKKVHFAVPEASSTKKKVDKKPQLTINEEQLDLTLSMLKNASPNEIDDEEETICAMEQKSTEMGNLIEKKVLQCTDKKDQLELLNEQYLQALALYQQLMQEPANPIPPSYPTLAAASPQQHSLLYQQQMLAHGLPQQLGAAAALPALNRGYTALPTTASALDEATLRQQLLLQQQQQQMLQLQQYPGQQQMSSLPPNIAADPALVRRQMVPPSAQQQAIAQQVAALQQPQDYTQFLQEQYQQTTAAGHSAVAGATAVGGVRLPDGTHYAPQQTEYNTPNFAGGYPALAPSTYTTSVYQ